MRLLNGHSLAVREVFQPESMPLALMERKSTATISVGPEAPEMTVGDWLQDETEPGAGIVWRVKGVEYQIETETRTIQLEHLIVALKDRVMFGEVKPQNMGGTAAGCTARQAVEFILSHQSDWRLGSFSYGAVVNPYTFNGDDLLSAMETVSSSLEDCWWSYDFSSYPFTLNITVRSEEVGTELRMSRNIQTAKYAVDRSRMYTRHYPIGKDNLHIDGDYVSRNENLYGTICKVETDQSKATKAELQRWAEERIRNHCEPAVTVTVQLIDVSEESGESLDQIRLGRKCRMPVPGLPEPILETITKIQWPDKISDKKKATATLANIQEDVASIINQMNKSGGGGGRAAAKEAEEDHAWFVDTNDHVAMIAEAVAGEGAAEDWSRVAEVLVDGEGIHQRVTKTEGDIVTAFAQINITDQEIRSEVIASQSQIYTAISQTATGIRTELVNAESNLYAYVDQTASYFRQHYGSAANNWVQDTDPRDGGVEPKDGDFWIESTFNGTWDGAEGFNWDHEEEYDWTQLQGAKIWTWKNDHWELVSDQQQVVTATDVEETAEHILNRAIKVMTNDDGNLSVYRAELIQEGDRIRSEVNELLSDFGSTIEQTASAIRTEVHAAESSLYSFVLQTASQITIRVGESNMVFTGKTRPQGTAQHPLVDGDLWLESTFQRTWDDMEQLDAWIDDEDYDWSDLKGSTLHVYDSALGDFREALDETALASDTDIEEEKDRISLIARQVKQVDGKVDVFRAEVKVQSDKVTSTLNQRVADLGSNITQTASQIRSEVHAANSQIYSHITQTASQIKMEVANNLEDMGSSIEQTASQIRSEVHAAQSTLYSTITQTASQIRLEVKNTASGLSSRITQNANSIELKVSKNGVISAINQTAESILIQASRINLDGYVTTSMMSSAFQDIQQATINSLTIRNYCTFLGYNATWQETTIPVLSYSGNIAVMYKSGSSEYSMSGYILRGHSNKTIYYLGR